MDHPALTRATASAHSIMASISSSTATPLAAMATPFPPGSPYAPGDDDTGECKLLGPFSLLVQAALGALALLSLVYKRYRERPQRPVKIWAFDASKQVFGSAMLHLANLLMSMFSAGKFEITARKYQPNPCSFYLLNLGIDVSSHIHCRKNAAHVSPTDYSWDSDPDFYTSHSQRVGHVHTAC